MNKLPKSNCSLQDADIVFYRFLHESVIPFSLPATVEKTETPLGIIKAPPIVAHRILLKSQQGASTLSFKNNPLEFSLFLKENACEEDIEMYWDGIMTKIQKNNFPTLWIFMPEPELFLLVGKVIKSLGMFHFYESSTVFPERPYLLTQSTKGLKTHLLSSDVLFPLS